ncbi:MAG: hypothetical protein KKF65_03435 [Nanoarchaeota archaeon]|nr:hypothetical protein [Nanoarchaeota archaeon]
MDTNKKVVDFIIGFFGNLGVLIVYSIFIALFINLMQFIPLSIGPAVGYTLLALAPIILIVGDILLIRYFFKRRRYIAIGGVSLILAILLASGACFAIFLG